MLGDSTPINAGLLAPNTHPILAGTPPGHIALSVRFFSRAGVVIIAFSSILVFIISVARQQQTAWPLMNISQYAAPYPSIYFFRVGASMSACAMLVIAWVFWKESSINGKSDSNGTVMLRQSTHQRVDGASKWNALGFFLSAIGLGGAGLISCFENNTVHTAFAFLMFVSQAAIQTGDTLCRRVSPHRNQKCSWQRAGKVLGCCYLWLSLFITGLMVSRVITKVNVIISIMEWSGSAELLAYIWWNVGKYESDHKSSSSGDDDDSIIGGGTFGSDAGSIGDDALYNDVN